MQHAIATYHIPLIMPHGIIEYSQVRAVHVTLADQVFCWPRVLAQRFLSDWCGGKPIWNGVKGPNQGRMFFFDTVLF